MKKRLYRPILRRLHAEIWGDEERFPDMNITAIAQMSGVSRQTIYDWLDRDVDDPSRWLAAYKGPIEHRLRETYSYILGRPVEVLQAVEVDE